jgi:phosphatidylserine/phosphatidylglycerophosphate/cardiolipin synthase-like enzyme
MHAKYIIADNMDVYLGSCNFDWLSLTNVHEIGVRIQNTKFASYVQKVFETDWELCITKKLPAIKKTKLKKLPVIETKYNNSKIKVTPVFSPASTTPNNCPIEIEEIVKYIDSAENSIFLNVMEYSPKSQYCDLYSDLFDSALRKAGVRGVNVKILASNWCMHEPNISFLKSISMIPNIEVKLFTIPRLKKQYLPFARVQHCKYLVIDKEKAWLGSSNWEPDYFLRSRNVSMLIQGFETTITLRQMFLNSWTSKYAEFIDSKKQYKRPQVMD